MGQGSQEVCGVKWWFGFKKRYFPRFRHRFANESRLSHSRACHPGPMNAFERRV